MFNFCCCCCCWFWFLVLFRCLFFHLFLTDQNKIKQRTSQNREKLETQYPSVQAESNTLLNRCLFLSVSFSNLNELNRPEQEKVNEIPVSNSSFSHAVNTTNQSPRSWRSVINITRRLRRFFQMWVKLKFQSYEISDKYCLLLYGLPVHDEMEHSDWFLCRSIFSSPDRQMDRLRHALFCFGL